MGNLTPLRQLLDDADEALDKETYEQIKRADFDAPDDAELMITHGTQRKVNRLFAAIDVLLKAQGV